MELWDAHEYIPLTTFECYQTTHKWENKEFDLLLMDEGDFAITPKYIKVLLQNKFKNVLLFTGTLDKDKRRIITKYYNVIHEVDIKEAENFLNAYFETFPGVKNYIDRYRKIAIKEGYVRNNWGRIAHLVDLKDFREAFESKDDIIKTMLNNAINSPIQGDIGVLALVCMNKIHNKIKELNLKSRLILQVHDSIVLDVPAKEILIIDKITEEIMNYHYDFYGDIEMTSDISWGAEWGFGHDTEYWKQHPNELDKELLLIADRNRINGKRSHVLSYKDIFE
jgi:hypothetical protein